MLPIVLLLLLGMVDFGKAFNYWIDTTHLANEGARYAVVNKNPSTTPGQSLQQYIQGEADTGELRNGGSSSLPTAAQVCIDFPNSTSNVGDPVRVTVRADYHLLPFLGDKLSISVPKALDSTATMRLEAPPSNYAAGCS